MLGLNKQQKSIVFGSWLGWSLDGYDLVMMLLVIPLISSLFFQVGNPTLALLSTFGAYIVTLVMRPIGGAFFGNLGDKHGRKKTMVITILGFSIATFATGLLPTWNQVGVMAPILLIGIRLIQGFFAGGEWGSGTVITMETVPKQFRGILSGFLQSGFNFGFVMASVAFQVATFVFPGEEFAQIGWRIMFFTGIIPGLIALFVRFKMVESESWVAKSKFVKKSPIKQVFSQKISRKHFFLALIIMTGLMYSYYSSMGFYPTFLQNYIKLDKPQVATLMIVATTTSLFGQIFVGFLSQKIGRTKSIAIIAASAMALSIPALYGLYVSQTIFERAVFTGLFIFIATTGFGPIPAFLSEKFSTEIRNSATGFVYNSGLIVGSWAPLVAVSLLSNTTEMIPYLLGLNVIIGSVIILIGTRVNSDSRHVDLNS
ncbi:MAG: MFS transporter [Nitrososphaeria archaeon]|nr:MFS transporter [Nitrososphaeria archaeon]NDB51561.1 MFS transporter [Nitrosopumilaceae archaeon]NDB87581.1 MFS transporter [Nitrososphaerota archaeon]NDB45797.1 MFS transporter [Nitrososphaeria archaeon]NDB62291.1 MFS transporter [Nitrosopumilaceae archaeon]